MSFKARHAKARKASPTHLEHRQESSPVPSNPSRIASATRKSTSKFTTLPPQPTTAIPLTTTFTPPASCAENRLSMLPPPGFFIWANPPVPAENITSSACYPSEFLKAYTAVSSGNFESSIVPVMSPLICPSDYCTMFAADNNYVACCPSGYQFHLPDTTIDLKRPAYGGTCYSSLTISSTYTVTQFGISGDTNLAPFVATATNAQAYAHPIDGFAPDSETPVVGCVTPVPLESQSLPVSKAKSSSYTSAFATTPPTTPNPAPIRQTPSKATIAGASIGAVGSLAAIIFLVWFILRCARQRRSVPSPRPTIYHIDHDNSKNQVSDKGCPEKTEKGLVFEKEGDVFIFEMATSEKFGNGKPRNSQLNGGQGAYEMHGDVIPELDGGGIGKKGETRDQKIGYAT